MTLLSSADSFSFNRPITIISLTDAGAALGQRLSENLTGSLANSHLSSSFTNQYQISQVHKPQPFKETVQRLFQDGHHLIFICATGIVIRTLAAVLDNKMNDPAVIVLDEMGKFVIPLLSGHEGGANQLADVISKVMDSELVLTTANHYLQPVYTVGMGCERDCSKESLMSLLTTSLNNAGLALSQITCIASIDIKADEIGLIQLAQQLNLPFICYEADVLRQVEDRLATPSDYVFNTVGVYGVAESAALVSAQSFDERGENDKRTLSELVLAKQKSKVATCSIARSYRESY